MFVATGSFFLGQADELPEWLRIFPLLALPVLATLVFTPYWLVKVLRPRTAPSGRTLATSNAGSRVESAL
jgi:hypothetical protein